MLSILTGNLQLKHLSAKFSSRLLTGVQTDYRMSVCMEFKNHLVADPDIMTNITTEDESLVYEYNSDAKMWSLQSKTSDYSF